MNVLKFSFIECIEIFVSFVYKLLKNTSFLLLFDKYTGDA